MPPPFSRGFSEKETIERVRNYLQPIYCVPTSQLWPQGLRLEFLFFRQGFSRCCNENKSRSGLKPYNNREKYIVRKAFENAENPYLPDEVTLEQKSSLAMV
jgi:asparagine synthase (glutamine-hydrolysing)